jgi:DNA (cytosine-5)-methyltransferase 1
MILTHLSLFSGIGGLDLAAEWAGFVTAGQCEAADYPTRILEKHWPGVPRWRDIRTLDKESFYGHTGLQTVDVISGGFPCQPFSCVGKRRGSKDDRFLWPEMLRVIKAIRPAWVVGENVAGFIDMALDTALSDLEAQGYQARAFVIPACGVDAPHERQRVFIVACADGVPAQLQRARQARLITGGADVADANYRSWLKRRDGQFQSVAEADGRRLADGRRTAPDVPGQWWKAEPGVGRVADGVSHRVDRLRCLGNAVVPQQAYPVFKAIHTITTSRQGG